MKKVYSLLCAALYSFVSNGQLLTWTPAFPKDTDNITIVLDASKGNQGLYNYSDPNNIYVHIGVTTNLSNNGGQQWLYVNGSTGGSWGSATPALHATSLGNNKYQYTITNIRSFFGVPAGETIRKIAILFRDANANPSLVKKAANADGSDMYIPIYSTSLAVRFTVPPFEPKFVPVAEPISKQVGDNINVTAISNGASEMQLYLNGTLIQSAIGVTTLSANPTLTLSGNTEIVAAAIVGPAAAKDTLRFFVSPTVNVAPLPPGVVDGINYAGNNTEVTLVLYAPGKSRVSVIGEFAGSNWIEQSQYVMNKTPDGNYWWLKITGLTPGTEYAYQYLVDGSLKIADPFTEKILDPGSDGAISPSTYPGLKPYPTGQTGIVSLLQTNAPAYSWSVTNFSRPDKRNLVIYELLLRDFITAHDWKTLKDTLNYLKALGVNAIEVMPFNEFEGNSSWGYNGFQYFAPDKYYGPKNTLKEFIDSCHKKGIAVIMDIVLNHTYGPSPLARLYWDAQNNRPAPNNPWYNAVAPTAFGFGEDFNHSSAATKYFFDRVLKHWLTEYKIDGYRIDFSKGLTQTPSSNDAQFSAYDASRIAILNSYANAIKSVYPDAYIILEHFCVDQEEKELADNGFLLWSNVWTQYQEAAMGFIPNSNLDRGVYTAHNFQSPHLVTFMESHDEERITFKAIKYGNSNGLYNVKDSLTALKRMELNTAFLLTIPGPKMVYEFGELGYDYSRCHLSTNGDGGDCNTKLDPKPIRWDYFQVELRKRVYDIYSSLSKLRYHGWYKDIFLGNNINIARSLGGAFKSIIIRSANDTSQLVVVGNFDITDQTSTVTFPTAGTWYDYLRGTTFTATGSGQSMTLVPGEYHVYVNRNLTNAVTTPVIDINNPPASLQLFVYPNPVENNSIAEIYVPERGNVQMDLWNVQGQRVRTIHNGTLAKGKHVMTLTDKTSNLPGGIYLLKLQTKNSSQSIKVIIK
jgi:1,4-alpha-glucan branching enzyme